MNPSIRRQMSLLLTLMLGLAGAAHGQTPIPAADAPAPPPPVPDPGAVVADVPASSPAPAAPDQVEVGEAQPAAPAGAQFGPEVNKAATEWQVAVRKTPRLVSLKAEAAAGDLQAQLKARLKVLGDKTYSNREWKDYWTKQVATASALADALAKGADDDASVKSMVSGLRSWTSLAKAKSNNQDVYLKAIETERDAIEDRLESAMDAPAANKEATAPAPSEEENPYEQRQRTLVELQKNIVTQRAKRVQTQSDLKLIEQQMQTEGILLKALVKDAELARTERDIARNESKTQAGTAWLEVWRELTKDAEAKMLTLDDEVDHGAARKRAREVEAGLARSQVKFRDERIKELETRYERDSGVRTLAEAAWKTFINWLTYDSWRIVIGLLLVWVGLKFALHLLGKGVTVVMNRAEGDPDDTTDDDHRVLTLVTVFQSVVKIGLYDVALLLALDQVGVNTAPLLGSVAILGLAISFGSQNLVRDVVNGFFILLENQFAVGEVVTISGSTGTVEKITIRSTWVRQASGDLHVIPNGSISMVTNLTRDWARAIVHVGVGYDADLKQVEEVVNRVGQEMFADEEWSEILEEAPAWVGVTELGDSAVTFRCMAKVTVGNQWGVGRELNQRLKVAFDAAGIEIPFPQRVVWNHAA